MAKRYRPAISYRLREIPLKSVKVWKDAQARKLDRKGVTELARSIKTEGLQNPPMVQKEGKYKAVITFDWPNCCAWGVFCTINELQQA